MPAPTAHDDAGPSGVRIAAVARTSGWPLATLDLPDETADALCDVLANVRAQRGAR